MAAPLAFRRPRTYTDRVRTWIEPLERRRLLSVTVENGIAIVRGTDGPDDISISMNYYPGSFAIQFSVHDSNTGFTWNGKDLAGIRIEAGGGNDLIFIEARDEAIPVTVLGGSGNDTITGTAADDHLDGQAGNDSIDGGGGNDTLPDDPWHSTGRDPAVIYDRYDRPLGVARIVDGTLFVTTGEGTQRIQVGDLSATGGAISVTINHEAVYFDRADIRAISVDAGAGDDFIDFRSFGHPLNVPVTLSGGDGDDSLAGLWSADASDTPIAPDALGPITLLGGNGNDSLYGSAGPTLLDGGPGIDQLRARGKDTIFVDPGEQPVAPPPPESPSPAPEPVDAPAPAPTEEAPEPTDDPEPSGAAVLAAPPTTAAAAAGDPAPAVYDDASPLLGGADDDDVFAD